MIFFLLFDVDDVDVKKALAFEHGLHQHLKTSHAGLLKKLEDNKAMDKDAESELAGAIAAFKKSFALNPIDLTL